MTQKPKPNLWSDRIDRVLKKFPSIILMPEDPNYDATRKMGRIVWRCSEHPYLQFERDDLETYNSPVDGKPAYKSLPKGRCICCRPLDKQNLLLSVCNGRCPKQKTDGYTKMKELFF